MWSGTRFARIWWSGPGSGDGRVSGIACMATQRRFWTKGRCPCREIGGGTSNRRRARPSWCRYDGRSCVGLRSARRRGKSEQPGGWACSPRCVLAVGRRNHRRRSHPNHLKTPDPFMSQVRILPGVLASHCGVMNCGIVAPSFVYPFSCFDAKYPFLRKNSMEKSL